jgi:hypothetical protein
MKGWLTREDGSRAVHLTKRGMKAMTERLEIIDVAQTLPPRLIRFRAVSIFAPANVGFIASSLLAQIDGI